MSRLLNEPVLIGAAIRATLLALIALQYLVLTDQQIASVMIAVEAIIALVTRALVTPNQLAEHRVDMGGRPSVPLGKAAFLLVLFLPASAYAQTHPCDTTAPTTVTVQSSATHKAQFCARPADNPEAMVVYVNGTATDLRPLTMTAPASAAGLALYEGPKELQFPVGSYQVQVTVYNRVYPGGPTQESAKSNPLSLGAVADNPPAAAPKLLNIVK